jgi:hypothetical protein
MGIISLEATQLRPSLTSAVTTKQTHEHHIAARGTRLRSRYTFIFTENVFVGKENALQLTSSHASVRRKLTFRAVSGTIFLRPIYIS